MNIEEIRSFCLSLPGTTEDIKWEDNLVFSVSEKIFCLAGLDTPLRVSFKVTEDVFDDLTLSDGIIQASHFAKRKWVTVIHEDQLSRFEWEKHLQQSYELVKANLPKKKQADLNSTR